MQGEFWHSSKANVARWFALSFADDEQQGSMQEGKGSTRWNVLDSTGISVHFLKRVARRRCYPVCAPRNSSSFLLLQKENDVIATRLNNLLAFLENFINERGCIWTTLAREVFAVRLPVRCCSKYFFRCCSKYFFLLPDGVKRMIYVRLKISRN